MENNQWYDRQALTPVWEYPPLKLVAQRYEPHVEDLLCGRIKREVGSQGKEKEHNNNFVGRTPKEKGERVTRCG